MNVMANLTSEEMAKIKKFTETENEAEAVTKAAREYLRISQLRELKSASGKVEYKDMGDAMETLELRERDLGQ